MNLPAIRPIPTRATDRAAQSNDLASLAPSFERLRRQHGLAHVPVDDVRRLIESTPRIADDDDANDVPTRIAKHLEQHWPKWHDIALVSPRTASWNASVFRVQTGGKTVAVAKNFGHKWRDFLCEVTALWHLRQQPGDRLATVAMLGAGHTVVDGAPQPFLLMEAPGDEDLENTQVAAQSSLTWQRYLGHLVQAGEQVAAVHQRFSPSQDARAIDQSREMHLRQVRSMANTSLATLRDRQWLTSQELAGWAHHIDATTEAYAKLPHAKLHLSVTLGDCYAANFVVHRDPSGLSLVDVQTLLWNMGTQSPKPTGIADAREDIGRFLEALTLRGICLGLSARKLRSQERAFWRGYRKHMGTQGVARDDQHLQLYRLRFQTVIWRSAVEGRVDKFSSEEVRRYLRHATRRVRVDARIRLYQGHSAISHCNACVKLT